MGISISSISGHKHMWPWYLKNNYRNRTVSVNQKLRYVRAKCSWSLSVLSTDKDFYQFGHLFWLQTAKHQQQRVKYVFLERDYCWSCFSYTKYHGSISGFLGSLNGCRMMAEVLGIMFSRKKENGKGDGWIKKAKVS